MTDLDFESDQLLVLLTDALAAGPGSPAWHAAVTQLRDSGVDSADEMTLLLRAREHLESGKDFRTIRAGAGFTKQLMSSLDATPITAPTRQSNRLLVGVSVAIIAVALAAVIVLLIRSSNDATNDNTNSGVLINNVASVDFEDGIPDDWEHIGGLSLTTTRNLLRPEDKGPADATGAGLGWKKVLPAAEPFTFSAACRLPKTDSDWVAQMFISDAAAFRTGTGVTAHEFVWLCQGHSVSVISPSGQVLTQQTLPTDSRNYLPVRLTVNGSHIVVEQSNRQLWAGENELDPTKPRTVGLRFIKAGKNLADDIGFSRVRINTRQGVDLKP